MSELAEYHLFTKCNEVTNACFILNIVHLVIVTVTCTTERIFLTVELDNVNLALAVTFLGTAGTDKRLAVADFSVNESLQIKLFEQT